MIAKNNLPKYYGSAQGLSSVQLKNIAIVAMLIDHIAYAFLAPIAYAHSIHSNVFVLYEILRGLGRLTMPLMAFCLVEGFCYTRSLPKYLVRLFLFACISHYPYVFFNTGVWALQADKWQFFHTSVIPNFFLALLTLTICAKTNLNVVLKVIATFVLLILSWFCDWSFYIIILALIFYYLRPYAILKLFAYIISIPVFLALYYWSEVVADASTKGLIGMFSNSVQTTITEFNLYYPYRLFFLGLFLVIPFLFFYNGKPGKKVIGAKYFFYIFYPLHLFILGLIKFGSPFEWLKLPF